VNEIQKFLRMLITNRKAGTGYKPFLEKMAGMVRNNIYMFRNNDLFWIYR